MKKYRTVLVSVFLAVLLAGVHAQVDEAAVPVEDLQNIQASLERLDELLSLPQDTPPPDALSALQGMQAEFERLRAELSVRDRELAVQAQALAAAETRIADLNGRLNEVPAAADQARLNEYQARLGNLEDENQILKAEIDRQHRRADKAEAEHREATAAFERLFNEAAGVDGQRAVASDDTAVRDLSVALEDMKAVDAQRRAAMDDLFRQLALRDRDLAAQVAALAATQATLDEVRAMMASRDRDMVSRDAQILALEQALTDGRAERDLLKAKRVEATQAAAEKAAELASLEARLLDLQKETDRVKLVDEQRRKTLDETLAALAESKQQAVVLGVDLEKERAAHTAAVRRHEEALAELVARKSVLDREVEQMERDVTAAVEARDAAQAKRDEQYAALTARDRQVVDLEEQVARLTVVDEQRRKAMDRILLDIALLEQEKGQFQATIQRLQAASQTAAASGGALDADLARLRSENAVHLERIASLESALQSRPALDMDPAAIPLQWEQISGDREPPALEAQLQEWREASSRDAERLAQMTKELEQARLKSTELAATLSQMEGRRPDIRDSDLYKELEQINAMLREKMLEVEADRQRLSQVVAQASDRDVQQAKVIAGQSKARETAEAALAEALAREGEYQELLERLVPQVAELEQQVTALVQERLELTNRLRARDEDLQTLKVELERREHRLEKAERVAEVLERARVEVMQAGDREKLNMHYNMAAVYAREGKFAEAEREYLQALRIDPTDADVHYNLGILYDDELKQPEKATVHYRRYLQLTPHGPDADRVRNWLMKLDMRTQR